MPADVEIYLKWPSPRASVAPVLQSNFEFQFYLFHESVMVNKALGCRTCQKYM